MLYLHSFPLSEGITIRNGRTFQIAAGNVLALPKVLCGQMKIYGEKNCANGQDA